jgi:hypothetical protein
MMVKERLLIDIEEIIWYLHTLIERIDKENAASASENIKILQEITKMVMNIYVKADN